MADDVILAKAAAIERCVMRVREVHLLARAGLLDASVAERMQRMVGFRNIAIHDNQKLSMVVVAAIVRERLDDFLDFTRNALGLA